MIEGNGHDGWNRRCQKVCYEEISGGIYERIFLKSRDTVKKLYEFAKLMIIQERTKICNS